MIICVIGTSLVEFGDNVVINDAKVLADIYTPVIKTFTYVSSNIRILYSSNEEMRISENKHSHGFMLHVI